MSAIGASDSSPPATSPVSSPEANAHHLLSIWRSPVAYLFGGMAAVSMLISSALLILILSYWQYKNRLNRAEEEEEGRRSRDLESADEMMNFNRLTERSVKATTTYAVVMAGDELPRFLASPRCYRAFDLEEEKMKRSSETSPCEGASVSPAPRVYV